jgi:hypothetical protein
MEQSKEPYSPENEPLQKQSKQRTDLLVVRRSRSGYDEIQGRYVVTKAFHENSHIKRHGKSTYSYCIGIRPVRKVPFNSARRILQVDFGYGGFDSCFNHGVKSNIIIEVSDNDFSKFKASVDLWVVVT